jgi:hypothetical protein
MSDHSQPNRPGLPELALGTAVLAADRLRQLATQMQDQLGRAVPTRAPANGTTMPHATFDPVHPSSAELAMNATHSAEPDWLTDAESLPVTEARPSSGASAATATGERSPMTLAVGLAGQSVDFMRNTRSRIFDATRVNTPLGLARDVVSNAGTRGRVSIAASRDAAARTLRGAMEDSITWADANIVPRMIDDLMPYLVNSVIPRIIDGAMPQIRQKVIPVVIDDLTADPRIRELITEQGRGVLDDAADELRSTSASADDAVEASFRKLFHLTPDTDR